MPKRPSRSKKQMTCPAGQILIRGKCYKVLSVNLTGYAPRGTECDPELRWFPVRLTRAMREALADAFPKK